MSPQKRNLLLAVAGGAALVVIVVVLMPDENDRRGETQPDPVAERETEEVAASPSDPVTTDEPAANPDRSRPVPKPIGAITREPSRATCTVLVNSMRTAKLSPQAPLYIEAVLSHASTETQIPLPDSDAWHPVVRDAEGNSVDAEFAPLLTPEDASSARQSVTFAWSAQADLAAGSYRVELSLPNDYPPRDSSISGVEIEPAWVEIADGATTSAQNDRYARRALAIQGRHDQLVTKLRGLIEEKPDELSLRLELVEALDGTENAAAAEKELLEFGYRLQQQSSRDWTIPDWLAFRLSDLRAKVDSAE